MMSVLIKEASFYKAPNNCKVEYEKHWPMLLILKTWTWQIEIKEIKIDILGINKLWWGQMITWHYSESDHMKKWISNDIQN